ncbi:aquaporin-like protein [Bimuria novae-zelandiae CBS 107.79]|uniref:Aquaporin-like protein n=1 Tax=Bimuria novae-zelandiae CBS 107.79 TaxID=1447943 RepID=A0A6A5VI00_9PLEO|nr:aquaporin-like protein [Bimuria novae-zelandiae CBS 107.79]
MSETSSGAPSIAARPKPSSPRKELTVAFGEFVGTFMFLFFHSLQHTINVAIFADVSGGMFNPAVSAALWVVGLIRWDRALYSIAAQLFASICATLAISALLPGPVPFNTALDPMASVPRGLFLVMFLTAQLVLTILMLPSGGAKPLYICVALFITQLAGIFFTGASLNSARSFGPAVVVGFHSYDWTYWLGPIIGAGIGAGMFILIHFLQKDES